jgi:hypothetical protein
MRHHLIVAAFLLIGVTACVPQDPSSLATSSAKDQANTVTGMVTGAVRAPIRFITRVGATGRNASGVVLAREMVFDIPLGTSGRVEFLF